MHLDPRIHASLLAGTLPPDEARALSRHLEAGCPSCEAQLAAPGRADAADGRVDRALAALAAAGAAGNDLEFERIARRLAAAPRERRVRRAAPALAAAVILAVGGAAFLAGRDGPARPAWDGTKGTAASGVQVHLRFLVVQGDGPSAVLHRGASGDAVPAAAGLGFEVTLERPAHVALVRLPPEGPPDTFWAGALPSGPTQVTVGDRPAVYQLTGLRGRHRFVAVVSEAPLDEAALASAAASAGAGTAAPGVTGADLVEVRIE